MKTTTKILTILLLAMMTMFIIIPVSAANGNNKATLVNSNIANTPDQTIRVVQTGTFNKANIQNVENGMSIQNVTLTQIGDKNSHKSANLNSGTVSVQKITSIQTGKSNKQISNNQNTGAALTQIIDITQTGNSNKQITNNINTGANGKQTIIAIQN